MNNTTVFDINKVSIEVYDAKTKKKEWNHLSNLNPNVDYEIKVVVEKTNLIFQIYNKLNKQDMHLNLKVKCQIHPDTKRPYVSSTTLRMIIKPPIIAFRYNIKDVLNNEIVLKKAQFGIPNNLSFQTMIDTLVEKGVTLKDSKNRDYNHSTLTNANLENNFDKFESQIIESQQQDRTFNISTPIEHAKPMNLSPVKENLSEANEDTIGYGNKQINSYQPFSTMLESNVRNAAKNISIVKPTQNSQRYYNSDPEDVRHYKQSQYNVTDNYNYYDQVNEEPLLPQQSYNSFSKNMNTKDLNYSNQEQSSQRNYREVNMNTYAARNNADSFNAPAFGYTSQHPEPLSRRCSFYEVPLEQVYNTQRRNSILVPILPQNNVSSNNDSKSKVMEKEDIESMMTSVLNNVLPKISDLQKPSTKELPVKRKETSTEFKASEICSTSVLKNVDGLSLEFFSCLDNQTKIGILKNLGFFQALKLISGCDKSTQKLLNGLIEKELNIPIKINNIIKANNSNNVSSQNLMINDQSGLREEDSSSVVKPKRNSKTSKTVLNKKPNNSKKVNKAKATASSPSSVLKTLETWEKIDEETVEGKVVGNRFLRKPRKCRLSNIFEQDDTESNVGSGCNETVVVQRKLSHEGSSVCRKRKSKMLSNMDFNTIKESNELNQRDINLDKTTEVINGNSYMNDIGNSSDIVEDEVFNHHIKYKKNHELLK